MFHFLTDELYFPNPIYANSRGVVAVAGDLSPDRLMLAYRSGIFPWYVPGEMIIWWSLDPRMVLFPKELIVHKSMRPYFNQQKYRVTYDQDFEGVITACSEVIRKGQNETWLSEDMKNAYIKLHKIGHAHSVEVWENDEMVGGLYGVSIGKVFCGESMFSKRKNASKFGFISLVRKLRVQGYEMIDCQQETSHLASLGAKAIPRNDFLKLLQKWK
jgi:leucyl/phenylalanyl-tRNA--protein transferase